MYKGILATIPPLYTHYIFFHSIGRQAVCRNPARPLPDCAMRSPGTAKPKVRIAGCSSAVYRTVR